MAVLEPREIADPGRGRWITTFGGGHFFLQSPDSADVDPVDIAHALSNICRFGGHTTSFYSVAQHSVLVSEIVGARFRDGWGREAPRDLLLAALLHDAAEAYVGDLVKPLKMVISSAYAAIERNVESAIARRFQLNETLFRSDWIKHADNVALATERRDLIVPCKFAWPDAVAPFDRPIRPWPPAEAKSWFLALLRALTGDLA